MSEYKGYQANLFAKFSDGSLNGLVAKRHAESQIVPPEQKAQADKIDSDLAAEVAKLMGKVASVTTPQALIALSADMAKVQESARLAKSDILSAPMKTAFENLLKDLDLKVIGESGSSRQDMATGAYLLTVLKHTAHVCIYKDETAPEHTRVDYHVIDGGKRILLASFLSTEKAFSSGVTPTAVQRTMHNFYTSDMPTGQNFNTLPDRVKYLKATGPWVTNTNGDAGFGKEVKPVSSVQEFLDKYPVAGTPDKTAPKK